MINTYGYWLNNMKKIELNKTGEKLPVLGQGTYGIFPDESDDFYENWKNILRKGIELGMTHIDTAELYGSGYSEKIIGEVIAEYERDKLFITTKMLPSNKTEREMRKAINNSLKRLNIDYADLYLIHWLETDSSIKKIIKVFEKFIDEGKTRYIGVSNFSVSEVKEAQEHLRKYELATNQVKINIANQEELKDINFYKKNDIILTAYTPLAKGRLTGLNNRVDNDLEEISVKYNKSKLQIALTWLINHENVIAIPRTSNISHLKENAKASEIKLEKNEIEKLNHF